MIITPQFFIVSVYGLKDILGNEPAYIIFRPEDGVTLLQTFDYDEANSCLIELINTEKDNLEKKHKDDDENIYINNNKLNELIITGKAVYIKEQDKVSFTSIFLSDDTNKIISDILKAFVESKLLKTEIKNKNITPDDNNMVNIKIL